MNSQPQKYAACEAARRYQADVIAGLSELVRGTVDAGDTDLWPALREKIVGMDTHHIDKCGFH